MNWILVVLVVFIVIAIVVAKIALQSEGLKSEFEYRKVGPLFTAAERSFLGVLKLAVNDEFEVFGKVRVADVITPKKVSNEAIGKDRLIKFQQNILIFYCVKKMTSRLFA